LKLTNQPEDPVLGRHIIPVAVFTLVYWALASLVAYGTGNAEFLFYVVVMVFLTAMVSAVHLSVNLTVATLWALSIWGLAHMAGGLVVVPESWPVNSESRVLYSWWIIPDLLKYDHVIHVYGFGITTWVCWQALRRAGEADGQPLRPTFGLMVLSAAAGMGFGALNEVVEFAATISLPNTNVGGYENTGWDLVANIVGVSIAAILIYWLDRGGHESAE
jgi:hypothetical protein